MRKRVLFYIYIVISTQTSKLSPTFLKIRLCSKWLWYFPNINTLHRWEICLFQVYLKCTVVNIFFTMYFVPGPVLIALHLLANVVLTIVQWDHYYHYFTKQGTSTKKVEHMESHSWWIMEWVLLREDCAANTVSNCPFTFRALQG